MYKSGMKRKASVLTVQMSLKIELLQSSVQRYDQTCQCFVAYFKDSYKYSESSQVWCQPDVNRLMK